MIIDLAVGKDGEVVDFQDAKNRRRDRGAWEGTKSSCGVLTARRSAASSMGLVHSHPHRQIWTLSQMRDGLCAMGGSVGPMAL